MRLLLAEDNSKLADWLARALVQHGYAVDCVHDGAAADHLLLTQPYDVVVLDLELPRMHGLEVLRKLRQRASKVPVLILTARSELDDRVKGLDSGADDYLVKPFELDELEARIRALIRRSAAAGQSEIALGPLAYDGASRMFRLAGTVLKLRPREHAVLEVLMLNAGKPVSKDALFDKVFSMDAQAHPEAVELYVHRLRRRLEGTGVVITTLRGLGYVLEAA